MIVVLFVASCGGGETSTASKGAGSGAKEPSAAFLKKTNRAIVGFGHEASVHEREEASAVIERNLKARAAADFSAQCATLSGKVIQGIRGAANPQECPKGLKKAAQPLSATKEIRADTLKGPIAALRVSGTHGYGLYHGTDGKNYAVPLEKEDGGWKVAAILTREI